MKTEEKSEKINRILGIISAVIGIVGSIFGIFQAQQAATLKNEVNSLQTASQQTIVNVVSTLGDDAKTSELTETGDMVAATDQLISVYSSTKTQNAQLTSEAQTLQSENEALKAQVENLKSVLLNTYSMDEVDKVVAQGYLDEVETKRLDNLEMLDTTKNHNHTPFACHCDKVGGPLFFCFIHIILSVVHRAWWSSGGRAAYSWGSCW